MLDVVNGMLSYQKIKNPSPCITYSYRKRETTFVHYFKGFTGTSLSLSTIADFVVEADNFRNINLAEAKKKKGTGIVCACDDGFIHLSYSR